MFARVRLAKLKCRNFLEISLPRFGYSWKLKILIFVVIWRGHFQHIKMATGVIPNIFKLKQETPPPTNGRRELGKTIDVSYLGVVIDVLTFTLQYMERWHFTHAGTNEIIQLLCFWMPELPWREGTRKNTDLYCIWPTRPEAVANCQSVEQFCNRIAQDARRIGPVKRIARWAKQCSCCSHEASQAGSRGRRERYTVCIISVGRMRDRALNEPNPRSCLHLLQALRISLCVPNRITAGDMPSKKQKKRRGEKAGAAGKDAGGGKSYFDIYGEQVCAEWSVTQQYSLWKILTPVN